MYLKNIEIQGFKSFADKISLDFNSGITSVVGPNGSGKSNIADAVRWVLGEQSAKTLRGTKMEDIIFAGTEHRRPVGYAQVSLTIDNGDGTLPVDYSEVTVTRRVYRSGESEYLLNKTPCRLKDIHELFLDTGIGKDGYSIIGQGRVDEILSTKSEDRRHIFEEASGIMKYKVRKIEAERKLEKTEQNLIRINDILNELENQLIPLQEQSEIAKKYLGIRDKLKELEINVYLDNICRFKQKINEFDLKYTEIKQNIDDENNKLERITLENKQKSDLLNSLKIKLENSKSDYYNIEKELEKSDNEIKLNNEKIKNYKENNLRLEQEIEEFEFRINQLSEDELKKKDKVKYLNDNLNKYDLLLASAQAELDLVVSTLDENERYIENLKTSIMDKLDVLSDKKSQVGNVKQHIDGIIDRQSKIDREIHELLLEKDRDNIQKEDLNENIRSLNSSINIAKSKIEEFTNQKNNKSLKLEDSKLKQSRMKSDIHIKSSRITMLKDMEKNLEGYNKSVKSVLHACQNSQEFGKGIHGALAQLIEVDKKYETAIEMSLGSSLQNIVTSNEHDAKRAIAFLKKNNVGRATFLPITAIKGRNFDYNLKKQISNHPGFCGIASDLIRCDKAYNEIILSLLGKVVIVENIDIGINMAKKFSHAFKIVTLEGDILNAGGSMSGGSTYNKGVGILSRSREVGELEKEIEILNDKYNEMNELVNLLVVNLSKLEDEINLENKLLRDCELSRMRDESHVNQLEQNIIKIDAKMDMLKEEKIQLEDEKEKTQVEKTKYEEELVITENEIQETKDIISKNQEKNKEEQTKRDVLHQDITDYKISVNSFIESLNTINESIESINKEKESLTGNIARRNNEYIKGNEKIKSIEENNENIQKSILGLQNERTGKTLEIDSVEEDRRILEDELSNIIEDVTNLNKNILLLQEEFNRLEVRKAKMETELDLIQNRLWDEYELTYSNALQFKKDISNMAQAQKEINEYKAQIKELGPVNVNSIEEYIKTKERYSFMMNQREDMEQAKEKLHRVINKMIGIMKQRFIEQFDLINKNFNIVFKELFDGGRAELILVDKENILESGIEIEAQPPGKKLQNMMLLSGGERAFTAIALLFSILRLRPTPFCILDEIEAALDDANVFKFADYIKKFTDQTQFIIVTHRKGTMEAADSLYGVTMQEHGISKVVSMKLGEKVS